jgi:hypothetical protein
VYDTNPPSGSEDKVYNTKRRALGRPIDDVIPVEDYALLTIVQSPLSASGGVPKQQRVVELWFPYAENLGLLPPDELMRPEGVPVISFASCYSTMLLQ